MWKELIGHLLAAVVKYFANLVQYDATLDHD